MGNPEIDPLAASGAANPPSSGGPPGREAWVRENFTQIFGASAQDLRARGIDPRQYAREHRDEIRRFAQMQRGRGARVPSGRPGGAGHEGRAPQGPPDPGYGYGRGRRYGAGLGGPSAWIGILLVLFALRFLLVDSLAGTHAAVFWVLGIGGIMLLARVVLFSWLRRRRYSRRQGD